MRKRFHLSRFLPWLMLALALRGFLPAAMMPVALAAPVAESHCMEHEDAGADGEHGAAVCRIVCDLGSAPAVTAPAATAVDAAPPVRVAVIPRWLAVETPPPDHPPPI